MNRFLLGCLAPVEWFWAVLLTWPKSVIGLILGIVVTVSATGCGSEPKAERQAVSSNSGYVVEALFVVDGATVYRFHDKSEWRYFVLPAGQTMGRYTTSNGKTTTSHPSTVPTIVPVPVERGK